MSGNDFPILIDQYGNIELEIANAVCNLADLLGSVYGKFPVFFPVSREFSGERLARNCILYHSVFSAEKSRRFSPKIRENAQILAFSSAFNGEEIPTSWDRYISPLRSNSFRADGFSRTQTKVMRFTAAMHFRVKTLRILGLLCE
jgi:hypothetical protein